MICRCQRLGVTLLLVKAVTWHFYATYLQAFTLFGTLFSPASGATSWIWLFSLRSRRKANSSPNSYHWTRNQFNPQTCLILCNVIMSSAISARSAQTSSMPEAHSEHATAAKRKATWATLLHSTRPQQSNRLHCDEIVCLKFLIRCQTARAATRNNNRLVMLLETTSFKFLL
jgi:hypothetical protein